MLADRARGLHRVVCGVNQRQTAYFWPAFTADTAARNASK